MSEKELWRAVQSLTNVQSVDVGSEFYSDWQVLPMDHFPNDLFQSATSVTLVGRMQYGLVKSILNAVNPATLQYFCLDVVYESLNEQVRNWYNDKRIKALGAPSGLLSILTGRCVALRTLILRRKVHKRHFEGMLAEAEEYSYEEWASFIRSVQGTVEQFTFEQAELFPETPSSHFLDHGISPHRIMDCYSIMDSRYRYMDERFRRVILPTIVSGKWPCLTMIELVGVRNPNGEAGDATLIKQLQALIAGDTTVVVKENAELVEVRQLTGS
ncbi:hypothetical protein MMC07_001281 [Pseudocyphellaria aurata]|nr:hypothetical protein [Pseudocyphellaria aurata]